MAPPPLESVDAADAKKSVPRGVWSKCEKCEVVLMAAEVEANLYVCPKCEHHMAIPTPQRIAMIVDDGTFTEHDEALGSTDPLEFKDQKRYRDRVAFVRRADVVEARRVDDVVDERLEVRARHAGIERKARALRLLDEALCFDHALGELPRAAHFVILRREAPKDLIHGVLRRLRRLRMTS